MEKLRIAILASGNGTNAQAMLDRIASGALAAEIGLIACNRPGAGVLDRARKAGVPHVLIDHTAYARREEYDKKLADTIQEHDCGLVVLAGYMRMLTTVFLQAFPGRVINLHPALLPSFPGLHGGADALAHGVAITGCTVHFVEEAMDSGPAIIQAAVPVMRGEDEDSLMQRIHAMEHRIYPQAIQWFAEGRISRQGRQVLVRDPDDGRKQQACIDSAPALVWPPLENGF